MTRWVEIELYLQGISELQGIADDHMRCCYDSGLVSSLALQSEQPCDDCGRYPALVVLLQRLTRVGFPVSRTIERKATLP